MVKAVIFDMDGLLIDSEPLWEQAFKAAFKKLDVNITSDDMLEVRGRRQVESIDHLFKKYDLKGQSEDDVKADIIKDMHKLIKAKGELLPGVIQVFKICKKADLPMAIASSSVKAIIDTVVEKFKIGHYFDHIYSAEYEPYGKPHPGTFISAAKNLAVEPTDCLVFEDAPGGVLAAKSAKMKCIAVPATTHENDKFVQTADIVLKSLDDFTSDMLG